MNTTKFNDMAARVTGFLGCMFLTIFAGFFGLMSVSALIMSAIDKDIISVLISAVAGFLACVCWSVRKDML